MKHTIPNQLLQYFGVEALKNTDENGQIETLALGLGFQKDDAIIIEELIFPNQKGSSTHVEELDIAGQNSSMWIMQYSSCYQKSHQSVTYGLWK